MCSFILNALHCLMFTLFYEHFDYINALISVNLVVNILHLHPDKKSQVQINSTLRFPLQPI